MKSSVASAARSACVAATWDELPARTSSSESGICCCHARISSTVPSPLCSVVMTSVGQAIFGRSERISAQAMVPMKPICVETAVPPMNLHHHSNPSGGKALPSRLPMFCRAQYSTPWVSKSRMSSGTLSAAPTRSGGGVPTTVRVMTRSGLRVAKARAIVPPILAPTRWKRCTPRWSISGKSPRSRRSRLQG